VRTGRHHRRKRVPSLAGREGGTQKKKLIHPRGAAGEGEVYCWKRERKSRTYRIKNRVASQSREHKGGVGEEQPFMQALCHLRFTQACSRENRKAFSRRLKTGRIAPSKEGERGRQQRDGKEKKKRGCDPVLISSRPGTQEKQTQRGTGHIM